MKPRTAVLLARFEAAARDHEMVGSKRPEEQREVEIEYQDAKKKLIELLEQNNL